MIWKITKAMDVLGILMLLVAAICLGASAWFQDFLLKGFFLQGFFPALMVGVGMLLAARIVDISVFLLHSPATAAGARAAGRRDLRLITTHADAGIEAIDNAA